MEDFPIADSLAARAKRSASMASLPFRLRRAHSQAITASISISHNSNDPPPPPLEPGVELGGGA